MQPCRRSDSDRPGRRDPADGTRSTRWSGPRRSPCPSRGCRRRSAPRPSTPPPAPAAARRRRLRADLGGVLGRQRRPRRRAASPARGSSRCRAPANDDGEVEAVQPPARQRVVELADAVRLVIEQFVAFSVHGSSPPRAGLGRRPRRQSSRRAAALPACRASRSIAARRATSTTVKTSTNSTQRDHREDLDARRCVRSMSVYISVPPAVARRPAPPRRRRLGFDVGAEPLQVGDERDDLPVSARRSKPALASGRSATRVRLRLQVRLRLPLVAVGIRHAEPAQRDDLALGVRSYRASCRRATDSRHDRARRRRARLASCGRSARSRDTCRRRDAGPGPVRFEPHRNGWS